MLQTVSPPFSSQKLAPSACPVCFSPAIRFAFTRNNLSIYSCSSCALEFQFPQPTDSALAAIYSSDYFLGASNARSLANQEALKRATARLYLNALAPCLTSARPNLLEIGCGNGAFLFEAQSRGFAVEGLEYSEHAAGQANALLGRPAVQVGSPEVDRLSRAAYDLIAAFDVIEHLRDPRRSLAYLHSALRPGGFIALVTPSLDSWSRHLLGRYWMEYKTEHLTYFSRKSLAALLASTGFASVRFLPNYKTLNLEYVSSHFERFPVPVLSPIVRLLRRILPAALVRRPLNIVASGVMAIAQKPL
ncbi:MAG: class I SAM-dependent methyltransferase [Acidobacteriaceae bacterium]|nr:class I SAM-dependent methyltransferase [Acidobacteriaceae bacterium]